MRGERKRPSPALDEGGNGDGGGTARCGVRRTRSWQRARRFGKWGGTGAWNCGVGAQETGTRESCGEPWTNRAGMARAGCEPDSGGDAKWARKGNQGSGRGARPWRREEVNLVGKAGRQTEAGGRTEAREQGGARGNQTCVGGGCGDIDSVGDRRAGDHRYLVIDKTTL